MSRTKKILKPLTFSLIEEGRLAKSLDESLAEVRTKLLEHVARYGTAATEKSRAKVSLEITISPSK